jgi:hypothetical protein
MNELKIKTSHYFEHQCTLHVVIEETPPGDDLSSKHDGEESSLSETNKTKIS